MPEVTISSTWKSAQPVSVNTLVDKVTNLYGLSGDDGAKKDALDCLDEAVKELNMQIWEFNIVTATGLAITANSRTVSLPTLFYKEKLAYLVNSSSQVVGDPLSYLDWATFERLYAYEINNSAPGIPRTYSVKNQARDGSAYLGPTPSSSDDTLTIQYYRRIEIPSQNAQLVVPEELENVILYGAKKRFAILIEGPDSPSVLRFHGLEQEVFEKMQAADRRHPDEKTRFRLYNQRVNTVGGSIYVRIN